MIIANFTTVKPEMAHSRTYEDFSKFLGEKPARLGIVARMQPYEDMTASYLTESIGNIVRNKEKSGNKYQKLDALVFEWEIEQNHIEYIPFVETPSGDGSNGSEITMVFPRRYYEAEDTFMIQESKQMCFVMEAPTRKSDNYWVYQVRLMGGDREATLDLSACYPRAKTRWIGNVKPEYHSQGFVKFQSNVEKQRGYISEIRVDIDASSRYEALEQTFIKLSRGSEANGWESKIFAWPEKKRLLLDNFMAARNNSMLWQHTTMDENGKSTLSDRQGRPIIAGDGIIPQINRFASKFSYSKFSPSLLNEIILTLSRKCKNVQGNQFAFVVNEKLYSDLQNTLSEFLMNHRVEGGHLWSKGSNGYVKVGATYDTYEFLGNEVIFHVDRALSIEYGDKGYGIMIDLSADKSSGRPAIEQFTVENKEIVENTLRGVGIQNGDVSTPVAGIKWIMSGYCGVAVYAPFRSVVILEN